METTLGVLEVLEVTVSVSDIALAEGVV